MQVTYLIYTNPIYLSGFPSPTPLAYARQRLKIGRVCLMFEQRGSFYTTVTEALRGCRVRAKCAGWGKIESGDTTLACGIIVGYGSFFLTYDLIDLPALLRSMLHCVCHPPLPTMS